MTYVPTIQPIAHIAAGRTADCALRYITSGVPVVVTRAAAHWDAVGKWSFSWFAEHFHDRSVTVTLDGPLSGNRSKMRMGDYLQLIENPQLDAPPYVRLEPLPGVLPELMADFAMPVHCPSGRAIMVHLWLGPANTVQPFHKDNLNPLAAIDNILVQIRGRKVVSLVSADQDELMYPYPAGSVHANYSQVAFPGVDLDRFPAFRDVRVTEALIEPGDMVFIPSDTWHHVRSLEPSVSLSFWWYQSAIADLIAALTSAPGADRASLLGTQSRQAIDELAVAEFGGIWAFALAARTVPGQRRRLLDGACTTAVADELAEALRHLESRR